MEALGRFPYRCLPLLIANQSGWVLVNQQTFVARWSGGPEAPDLVVDPPGAAMSHFGLGVVTWYVGYLFRTPPGWNLVVRGVPNQIKDGAQSLEGVVETDWAVAPFTHNWRMTRPGQVAFEVGEPIGLIQPQRRGELESWQPQIVAQDDVPDEVREQQQAWLLSRMEFNMRWSRTPAEWQRDYFKGSSPGGARAEEHQTRLRLRPFAC